MSKQSKCPFLFWEEISFKRCPFLRCLSAKLSTEPQRVELFPILESPEKFYDTYEVFHGTQGTLPLGQEIEMKMSETETMHSEGAIEQNHGLKCSNIATQDKSAVPAFAAISFTSSFPSSVPGDEDGDCISRKITELEMRGILPSKADPQSARGAAGPKPKPQQPSSKVSQAKLSSSSSEGFLEGAAVSQTTSNAASQPAVFESKCPLSKIPVVKHLLGDMLSPVRVNNGGKTIKLECPAAVVRLRAAFAKTPPMRALRPQALPVRITAVAATSLVTNVPLGAWREHVVKFSPEWFVAIHASIPLVVLMRKGALLPQYAIIATIGCAVLGQLIGSRCERRRLRPASTSNQVPAKTAKCIQQAQGNLVLGLPALPLAVH